VNKKLSLLFILIFLSTTSFCQKENIINPPKLVVGIVIDQMRWDYLYRYTSNYSEGGFKRLQREGFSCDNTLIPYVPTYTAPGHTSIYTGSVPSINGIAGNDWYDASIKKNMYCTEDSTVQTVGSSSDQGKMSPRNLLVTTIGDELRLKSNFRNKVIGISLKDRGAILPAGHAANAAYWYDDTNGSWISSTYYQAQLPGWVKKINDNKYPEKAMASDWKLLLPLEKYTMSTADDRKYEGKIPGEESTTFPHLLSKTGKNKLSAFKYTPYAATFTFNMAKDAIANEQLGKSGYTDMLTVSISSTDYMGHTFGPNSLEAEDTYIRLDRDLADFLNYLDKSVGKGNYILFLTADHGVAHVPGFLEEKNINAGNFSNSTLTIDLIKMLSETLGLNKTLIKIQNNQLYIDFSEMNELKKDPIVVEKQIISFLQGRKDIAYAFSFKDLGAASLPAVIKSDLINGYNPERSGQMGFILKPGYIGMGYTGTTHGSWNPYDSHIPLIFYGNGIKHGTLNRETYMTDIAATITSLLKTQMPSGCIGKVITEAFK
jgi:predicted AlkP superfamily pyrophosphatase or phosphodiesterase